jgi:hypothetical protein
MIDIWPCSYCKQYMLWENLAGSFCVQLAYINRAQYPMHQQQTHDRVFEISIGDIGLRVRRACQCCCGCSKDCDDDRYCEP